MTLALSLIGEMIYTRKETYIHEKRPMKVTITLSNIRKTNFELELCRDLRTFVFLSFTREVSFIGHFSCMQVICI